MFERMYYTIIRTAHPHYAQYGSDREMILGSIYEDEEEARKNCEGIRRTEAQHNPESPATFRVALIRVTELVDVDYNATPALT